MSARWRSKKASRCSTNPLVQRGNATVSYAPCRPARTGLCSSTTIFSPIHIGWKGSTKPFRADPTISVITGHVVADGILGPGLAKEEALARVAAHDPASSDWIIENFSPYGCNMAFRQTAIDGIFFDERLVLYSWLEDRDLGAAVAKRGGRQIKLGSAFGAHLGVKRGRVSGRKFGYSK